MKLVPSVNVACPAFAVPASVLRAVAEVADKVPAAATPPVS